MKYLSLFILALAATALVGCVTPSFPGDCGQVQANCCGWEFYKATDLIEGQQERTCNNRCETRCVPNACLPQNCQPGVVVRRCVAVPVEAPAPAPDAPAPDAPGAAPAKEPEAAFAPPAEGR